MLHLSGAGHTAVQDLMSTAGDPEQVDDAYGVEPIEDDEQENPAADNSDTTEQ